MVKGLQRSIKRGNERTRQIVTKRISARDLTVSMTGASGVGYGTVALDGLPEGNILLLGAVAYVTVTEALAGVSDTFDGDFGIGTTPLDDGTITSGDVDIIGSTAIGPAVSGVTPRTQGTNATAAILDNTASDLELNLNLLIDDADISADGDVTVDVDLDIAFVVLGDD